MKMDANKTNGSLILAERRYTADSDPEEISGKVRVLVHQNAFDIPEDVPKRNNGSGEKYILNDHKPHDFHTKIVEHDDVITPLSEESNSSITGHAGEDKLSEEQEDTESNSCIQNLFPCWGTLIDPGTITVTRFFGLITCLFFYVANIISDIIVCYHLFLHCNWLWFSLAAAFTIIPTVILNSISYHLSVSKRIVKRTIWNQEESLCISFIIAVLHLAQFGIIARYLGYIFLHELEYLWVVFCPSHKQKDFNHHSGRCIELAYIPYLFIVEAILQCLPQLIVQMYILIVGSNILASDTICVLIISIVVSLLNLSRLLTLCKHLEKNCTTSFCGLFLIYLWYLFTSISRALSFTIFLTKFVLAFAMLCLFHWVIMSFWAVSILTPTVPCRNAKGCIKNIKKYLRGLLFGLMYILCFLRLKVEDDCEEPHIPTRYLYAFFYSVIFLENTVLTILWFVYSAHTWYSIPLVILVFTSFILGIFCMYLYYRYFHKNIKSHSSRWKCILQFPRAALEESCIRSGNPIKPKSWVKTSEMRVTL